MGLARILLADDSATVRIQVGRALSEAGFEVIEATNGLAALRLASTEPPALAILDINMPYLDGFGVCQQLKHMGPGWNDIPIVFLTASRSHALELLGEQLGAFVQKPISTDVLVTLVQELLAKQRAKTSGTEGAKSASSCTAEASS